MIDKLFTILIWLLIAAAIWLWIRLIIFVALLIVLWQGVLYMINQCDIRDRVELQKYIDNGDVTNDYNQIVRTFRSYFFFSQKL